MLRLGWDLLRRRNPRQMLQRGLHLLRQREGRGRMLRAGLLLLQSQMRQAGPVRKQSLCWLIRAAWRGLSWLQKAEPG
jgi:hypothetical protein